MLNSIILNSDSYKFSHYLQYPEKLESIYSYIESRGGLYKETLFFGLQAFIKEYLSKPFTHQDLEKAQVFIEEHIPSMKFNYDGWKYILDEYNGYLPIHIKAVPEGSVIPTHNVLVTVESTDPRCAWIVGHIETALLRSVWSGTSVATRSYEIKKILRSYVSQTCEDVDGVLSFMLHDFGARGVSSKESAGISGSAHLINFLGTDNIDGILFSNEYYDSGVSGFSVPASEHSVMMSWGKPEVCAYKNMIKQFGKKGSIFANVVDTCDPYNVCMHILPELKVSLEESGAKMVVRPDSGDPKTIVTELMMILDDGFGHTLNSKGFKVLNNISMIQGDGVNEDSIKAICESLIEHGYSLENIAFGCGGYLLQDITRDTQKFAMKPSQMVIGGEVIDVSKNPSTDPCKRSKTGRVDLYKNESGYYTSSKENHVNSCLKTVYMNGEIINTLTFDEVRENAKA